MASLAHVKLSMSRNAVAEAVGGVIWRESEIRATARMVVICF